MGRRLYIPLISATGTNFLRDLSEELGKPVFSFHIHDGDLWMYVLFDQGQEVDRFNPMPDYWEELDDEAERESWRGNATAVAERVPGLAPESIERYLIFWDDEILLSAGRPKAYPNDKFHIGDDWQIVDFMRRVGLSLPIDEQGQGAEARTGFARKSCTIRHSDEYAEVGSLLQKRDH